MLHAICFTLLLYSKMILSSTPKKSNKASLWVYFYDEKYVPRVNLTIMKTK